MEKIHIFLSCFFAMITIGSALECYSCESQDNNYDKCTKTTVQCKQFQDACTTYVRWGIPPYWTPRGDRIHFISKDCDTRIGCDKRKRAVGSFCKRDWYNDWACVECCTGDLCNYYVTLGSSSVKSSVLTIVTASLAYLFLQRLR